MDVGCGTGDLKAYLDERFSQVSYIGIDHVPEFIQRASIRFSGMPNTRFYQADFNAITTPKVDYVLASGALSYRTKTAGYYFEMIARMYAHAKKGLAFNMLDAASFPHHPLLVGHNKSDVERFCKQLSCNVYVIGNYLKDDFTVFMYR